MLDLFISIWIVGFLAAFCIIVADKFGWLEWLQTHGNEFISNLAKCNFCLGFWLGLVFAILAVLFTGNPALFVVPLCSAPLTRYICG